MYYLYILYSLSADKYYIGHSENPAQRFFEHNNSVRNTYTSKFRPWKMVALFECGATRAEALTIERLIKKQKSRTLIEKLVNNGNLNGELAQLVRVPHLRD